MLDVHYKVHPNILTICSLEDFLLKARPYGMIRKSSLKAAVLSRANYKKLTRYVAFINITVQLVVCDFGYDVSYVVHYGLNSDLY